MGKSHRVSKKRHLKQSESDQSASEDQTQPGMSSGSSSNDAPRPKKRKGGGSDNETSAGSSSSVPVLANAKGDGNLTKLAQHMQNIEVSDQPVNPTPGGSRPAGNSSEGNSGNVADSETNMEESDVTPSKKSTKKVTKKQKGAGKQPGKVYGMPQVIQGKILSETETSIYLKLNKSITICGKVNIRAVKGTVKVAGYEIQASERTYPVYSPNCCALLTITVVNTKDVNVNGVREDIKKKIFDCDSKCAVLEMSKLKCSRCDFVTSFEKNRHVFLSPGYPLPVVETRIITDHLPTLLEDPTHKEAADVICGLVATGSKPIVMLCGGKNAGKSTFCRYLLNRVLSVKGCDELAFLECDVGQTEFTPSSFVSLSTVTQPLLGPPFTHHAWPQEAVFYGYASPDKDAHGYMDCVRKMFHAYAHQSKQVPLIVNTMGWNKGLGLRLFLDTLRLTQATHIIQIDHPSEGRNFPDMTVDFVEASHGFRTQAGEKSHHELLHIPSLLNLQTEGQEKFTPKDHRNLVFFSYFGASLAETVPYEVPWGDISVLLNNDLAPAAQVLHVLNGSVVGLCALPQRPHQHTAPQVLPRDHGFTPLCKGLGVVQSIDPRRRVLRIITPVPLEQLVDVNCFKVGALALPEQLIMTQKLTEALPKTIPYFGDYKDTAGSSRVAKPRHMSRGKKHD